MSGWGDEIDVEAQKLEEFKPRFTINFKKIAEWTRLVDESTLEVTKDHPRDSLMILWAGSITGISIFFILCYSIFSFIALPFLLLYAYALYRIGKCWKNYNYGILKYWIMTVLALVASFALSRVIQWGIGIIRNG